MQDEIQAGDVVKLKSGGQAMTVECIGSGPASTASAYVVWMTPKANRRTAVIALDALMIAQ